MPLWSNWKRRDTVTDDAFAILRNMTDEEFFAIYADSRSVAEILRKMGLRPVGGNYDTVKRRLARLDLPMPVGQGWSAGQTVGPRKPIESYLAYGVIVQSDWLRRRLIKEGIKQAACEKCKNDTWLEHPIPLELDHIDGDRLNQQLENLAILCPNCHAQTPTYRGKNIKHKPH